MTKALVRYEPPGLKITIGSGGGCDVKDCEQVNTHVVFWVNKDWSQLNANMICARDAFLLNDVPGCLVYLENFAPSLEFILSHVNAEIARRRPPVQQVFYPQYGFSNGTGNSFTFRFNM